MQDGQLTTDNSTVRLIVLASVCVLLMAACGRAGHVLTLGSTETAVRAAGYSRLRVLDASAAISRLPRDYSQHLGHHLVHRQRRRIDFLRIRGRHKRRGLARLVAHVPGSHVPVCLSRIGRFPRGRQFDLTAPRPLFRIGF